MKLVLFETERLELHRMQPADRDFLVSLYGDPRMMTYLGGPHTPEQVETRMGTLLAHWQRHGYGIGILRLSATQTAVGTFAVFRTSILGEDVLEIGWTITPDHQRQGLAFEAARGALEYIRGHLAPCAVTAFPAAANVPSNRIPEKLGFRCLGPYRYPWIGATLESLYWRLDVAASPFRSAR